VLVAQAHLVMELTAVILFSHLLLQLVVVKVVLPATQLRVLQVARVVEVPVTQAPQAAAQERRVKVTMVVLALIHL
jgi:hypothetical protein